MEKTETKKVPLVVERVEFIEKSMTSLVDTLNKELMLLKQLQSATSEVLSAMVKVGGDEYKAKILETVEIEKKARKEESVKTRKAKIEEELANGRLVTSTIVDEGSLLVGREFNTDGSLLEDYVTVPISEVMLEIKDKLVGKTVGEVLELPNKMKFELLAIYNEVKQVKADAPIGTEADRLPN